jgi:hypothetical protein
VRQANNSLLNGKGISREIWWFSKYLRIEHNFKNQELCESSKITSKLQMLRSCSLALVPWVWRSPEALEIDRLPPLVRVRYPKDVPRDRTTTRQHLSCSYRFRTISRSNSVYLATNFRFFPYQRFRRPAIHQANLELW